MRALLFAALALGVFGTTSGTSYAADGCSYDYKGRLVCNPGAQPGVPYQGRDYGRRRDRDDRGYDRGDRSDGTIGTGCRGSGYNCRELRYHCSLGNQTPHSVRPFC